MRERDRTSASLAPVQRYSSLYPTNPLPPRRRYCGFVKKELNRGSQTSLVQLFGVGAPAASAPEKWPAWRLPKFSNSLLYPTALNLRSTLVSLHRRLEPWLLGDMVRRSPGKGASSDGTFRLMMRTK